jgi:cell shape-determining protein MreC
MVTEDAASQGGLAALLSSVFVGQIVSASPYTATVQLLSDPESGIQVRVGRVEAGLFKEVPADFILRGVGNSRMLIVESPRRHSESGAIRVGDAVVSLEGQNGLPQSLLIGRITTITQDPDQPLTLDRLEVQPATDTAGMTRVYVADFAHQVGAG